MTRFPFAPRLRHPFLCLCDLPGLESPLSFCGDAETSPDMPRAVSYQVVRRCGRGELEDSDEPQMIGDSRAAPTSRPRHLAAPWRSGLFCSSEHCSHAGAPQCRLSRPGVAHLYPRLHLWGAHLYPKPHLWRAYLYPGLHLWEITCAPGLVCGGSPVPQASPMGAHLCPRPHLWGLTCTPQASPMGRSPVPRSRLCLGLTSALPEGPSPC